MRSLDCSRDVPFAENTRQFVDEETYDAVVLKRKEHQVDVPHHRLKEAVQQERL
jgi:hypothetical protein